MSQTAVTRKRLNGADELAGIKADMYNLANSIHEKQGAFEERIEKKLDAVLGKMDAILAVLHLSGEQAKMLRDR